MKLSLKIIVILSIIGIFLVQIQQIPHAAFARRLNYQGRLTDSNGVPLASGNYDMVFSIYDASSGGTLIWTETHNSGTAQVAITNGLFSVVLGSYSSLNAVDFNGTEYWIQVAVSGTTYSPRKRLTATSNAINADLLDGNDSTFFQQRVTGTCGAGSSIRIINADGTVTCQTDVGVTAHGSLSGLGNDDHPQYFALSQNETVSGRPSFDGGDVTNPPFYVDSSIVVANLNADMLDGVHESSFFQLAQNETVTGIPAFNGGTSGSSAPFSVDSTYVVTNLNADYLDGYHYTSFILDGCTDCLNATEIEDIYVLNTSDTMSGSLGVGTDLTVSGNIIGDIKVDDTRAVNDAPTAFDNEVSFDFKNRATVGVPGSGTYSGMITIAPWGDNSGDASHQLNFNEGGIFWRQGQPDSATWDSWYQIGYNQNLDDRYVNITGDTMTGELISPAFRTPAAGFSSGAPLDSGDTAVDYPGNSGWPGTWNSNILLSGLDSTSISFHDSGVSVGTLRYIDDNFYIGQDVGWGVSNLTVGADVRAGYGIRAGGTSDVTDGSIAATQWIGAGCEGNCESSGGYALLYPDGTSVQTSYNRATYFSDYNDTAYYMDPNGSSYLNDVYPRRIGPRYGSWSGIGDGGSAIINDNTGYNALMIVGSDQGMGYGRWVRIWDYLTVQGSQSITGNLTLSGAMYRSCPSGFVARGTSLCVEDWDYSGYSMSACAGFCGTRGSNGAHMCTSIDVRQAMNINTSIGNSWDNDYIGDQTADDQGLIVNSITTINMDGNDGNINDTDRWCRCCVRLE